MKLISDLIRNGIEIKEAKECQQAIPSFPFVIQEEWPSKREDGKEEQHLNLTQIPFDVEVDEHSFSLDYYIAIAFEISTSKLAKDIILEKVKAQLEKMKIEVGEMIGEPTIMMSYYKSTNWSGVIKIHLKNLEKNGRALLQGSKAFILTLDDKMVRKEKVYKSYDALALNSLLSIKIVSENLKEKKWFQVFEDTVVEVSKEIMSMKLQMYKRKWNLTLLGL